MMIKWYILYAGHMQWSVGNLYHFLFIAFLELCKINMFELVTAASSTSTM